MAVVQQHPALNRPERPACSICVANYNGVDLLGDCLDSIFSQGCDFNFEVIVHDDASPDASVKFLRERYPQVEVLASEENVGFCIANNRMVEHARGEYVLLLNNDAALFPDALASLLESARAHQGAAILTLRQHDWETGELVDSGCLLDPFYNPVPNLDPARLEVATAIGACLFMPRALWTGLGGFPEWFGSIAEDMYLCCLARLRGAQVRTLPGSGFRHRLGASFGGARIDARKIRTTMRRRRLSERNKTFVLFVCTPTPAMWALLAVHLATLAVEGIVLSLLRFDWRLFIDVYANVPRALWLESGRLLALRKQAQASRTTSARAYSRNFTWVPRKLAMLASFGVPKVSR